MTGAALKDRGGSVLPQHSKTDEDATRHMVNRPSDELRLWFFVLRVHESVFEELNTELKHRVGLSLTQFDALAQLEKCPDGMTMTDLSKALRVTSGNVSGLVTRMARNDLVKRQVSPHDRRSFTATITPNGRRLFEDAVQRHDEKLDQIMSELSTQELTDGVAAMRRVAAGLKLARARDRIGTLPDT